MRPLPFSAGPILALIFWVAFACWVLPEIVAWRVKRSPNSSSPRDQGSLKLIAVLWWVGIALDFLLSVLLPQTAIPWKRTPLCLVGIGLMLSGIALRWYSVAVLGKYFTFDVAIHSGQVLVEAGPYRYIRHPSYSGALLSLLGLVCHSEIGRVFSLVFPVWGLPMPIAYPSRSPRLLWLSVRPTSNI